MKAAQTACPTSLENRPFLLLRHISITSRLEAAQPAPAFTQPEPLPDWIARAKVVRNPGPH